MKKLIPIVDFVLEHTKNFEATDKLDYLEIRELELSRIEKYAKFLKQPLKLEYFVPCDEHGNVLENPFKGGGRPARGVYEKYQQAKDKILFEGFKSKNKYKVYSNDWDINLDTLECYQYLDGGCLSFKLDGYSIEDIANKIGYLTLTQTALKQIGL